MKKVALFLVSVFIMGSVTMLHAQKDEGKVIETKGVKVEQTRGDDPHIKEAKPVNDEVVAKKPAEEAARTSYCKVIVENWTGYTIDIYVDGYYEGTVAAWGDGYTYTYSGNAELYGKSVGGTVTWGPKYIDCGSQYTWQLTY
jgi:hypothetical protein